MSLEGFELPRAEDVPEGAEEIEAREKAEKLIEDIRNAQSISGLIGVVRLAGGVQSNSGDFFT
jgi:hypothetical protein